MPWSFRCEWPQSPGQLLFPDMIKFIFKHVELIKVSGWDGVGEQA